MMSPSGLPPLASLVQSSAAADYDLFLGCQQDSSAYFSLTQDIHLIKTKVLYRYPIVFSR